MNGKKYFASVYHEECTHRQWYITSLQYPNIWKRSQTQKTKATKTSSQHVCPTQIFYSLYHSEGTWASYLCCYAKNRSHQSWSGLESKQWYHETWGWQIFRCLNWIMTNSIFDTSTISPSLVAPKRRYIGPIASRASSNTRNKA